jgi:hypothetical protein
MALLLPEQLLPRLSVLQQQQLLVLLLPQLLLLLLLPTHQGHSLPTAPARLHGQGWVQLGSWWHP